MSFLTDVSNFNAPTGQLPGDPPIASGSPIFNAFIPAIAAAVKGVEQKVNRALNLPVDTNPVGYQASSGLTNTGWIIIAVIVLLILIAIFA